MEPGIPQEEYEVYTERPRKKQIRPEAVLGLIALLAAAILAVSLIMSLPYVHKVKDDDPIQFLHSSHAQMEADEKDQPLGEGETEPQETTEPTIPPEANPYTKRDFQYGRHNYLYCTKQDSFPGVDVSAFQGEINWKKVQKSGIRFAIVRLGYRGYGAAGNMVEDEFVHQNLEGAKEAGLAVGAYFFSQATNIREVDEEIEFMLNILGDFELNMPIILDWEYISAEARTAHVDADTLTECMLHFCRVMEEKGYSPMIYFNWNQSIKLLHLHELEEYPFWLALYQDRMTYPYRVEMWQYTCTGRVPGISGDVDINVYMPDLRMQNG